MPRSEYQQITLTFVAALMDHPVVNPHHWRHYSNSKISAVCRLILKFISQSALSWQHVAPRANTIAHFKSAFIRWDRLIIKFWLASQSCRCYVRLLFSVSLKLASYCWGFVWFIYDILLLRLTDCIRM